MTDQSMEKIEAMVAGLLEEIGEDGTREGLVKTPERVAKSWAYFAQGYGQNLKDVVGDACFDVEYDEMVTVKDIEFFSMCEHHMLPFFGKAHIGYIPKAKVIGLSKLPRIVEMFARRLQVQERLTVQIGNAVKEILDPAGVGVVLEGAHLCMQMRGVEKMNSYTTTSHMLGVFRDNSNTRQEFLKIISMRGF